MNNNIGPDPQDPDSPLYDFIDEQPESPYPNNPDSSLSHFTVRQFTPTAISATLPVVVTKTAHGLLNGMAIRATQFISWPAANATGMTQGGQFTVNGPEILCVNPSHFPPPGIPVFPPA